MQAHLRSFTGANFAHFWPYILAHQPRAGDGHIPLLQFLLPLLGQSLQFIQCCLGYLKNELEEIYSDLEKTNSELEVLNSKRASYLETLKDKKTFSKYKRLNRELVSTKADIETLERQKFALEKLTKLEKDLRGLKKKKDQLAEKIRENIYNPSGLLVLFDAIGMMDSF